MAIKLKDGIQLPGGKVFLEAPANEVKIIKSENNKFKLEVGNSKLGEFSEKEAKTLFREFHAVDKGNRVLGFKLEEGPNGLQYRNMIAPRAELKISEIKLTKEPNLGADTSARAKINKRSLERTKPDILSKK